MPDDVSPTVDPRSVDDIITQMMMRQQQPAPTYPPGEKKYPPVDPQFMLDAYEKARKKWGDNRPRG